MMIGIMIFFRHGRRQSKTNELAAKSSPRRRPERTAVSKPRSKWPLLHALRQQRVRFIRSVKPARDPPGHQPARCPARELPAVGADADHAVSIAFPPIEARV